MVAIKQWDYEESLSEVSPEKALMCAVLKRAYMDLFDHLDVRLDETKDAINWFIYPSECFLHYSERVSFTFDDCSDILGLTPSQIQFFKRQAAVTQYQLIKLGTRPEPLGEHRYRISEN